MMAIRHREEGIKCPTDPHIFFEDEGAEVGFY